MPDHIEALQSQMAEEWRDQLTMAEMVGSYPEAIFQKHFLNASGQPDRQKTTEVLAVPVPSGSSYRRGRVLEEAGKVAGLRSESRGNTLYFGWDFAALEGAIAAHDKEQERARKREQEAREKRGAAGAVLPMSAAGR